MRHFGIDATISRVQYNTMLFVCFAWVAAADNAGIVTGAAAYTIDVATA